MDIALPHVKIIHYPKLGILKNTIFKVYAKESLLIPLHTLKHKMMKNKLLTALILMFLISSCEKSEDKIDNIPITQKGCYLSTVVEGTYKTVYTYDTENRVIKTEYFEANVLDYYETFTYTNTNVTIKYFEGNGTADGQDVAEMQNGRITKSVDTDTYTDNGFTYTYIATYVFEYTNVGFLIKTTGEFKTTTNKPNTPATTKTASTTYTYQNDNLIQTNYVSSSSNSISTDNYEYYTDKDNVLNMGYDIGDDDSHIFLFGKQSKNLLKKASYLSKEIYNGVTYNSSGNDAYTYEYDSNNKPKKAIESVSRTSNGVTTNETDSYNLTLNCK